MLGAVVLYSIFVRLFRLQSTSKSIENNIIVAKFPMQMRQRTSALATPKSASMSMMLKCCVVRRNKLRDFTRHFFFLIDEFSFSLVHIADFTPISHPLQRWSQEISINRTSCMSQRAISRLIVFVSSFVDDSISFSFYFSCFCRENF